MKLKPFSLASNANAQNKSDHYNQYVQTLIKDISIYLVIVILVECDCPHDTPE